MNLMQGLFCFSLHEFHPEIAGNGHSGLLKFKISEWKLPTCSLQLAASLLTTGKRFVIVKPEQAMRMHSDISLVIADLLQLARF